MLAFQLKRCPPPPAVPQADLLTEDEDFEIGNMSLLSFVPHHGTWLLIVSSDSNFR